MDFHNKLKKETKICHEQIESSPFLKKIVESNLTLDEYQCLIKKLYGYIMPCEITIHKLHFHHMLDNREKSILLEHDLLALGVLKNSLQLITRCCNLPIFSIFEHVLGYLYVIEGSTLGGQIITRILQNNLQLTPDHGIRYFNSYGKNTKATWGAFCQILNNITEHEQQNEIIIAAKQTYNTLYYWLLNY